MKKLLIGLFFLACTAFSYASSGNSTASVNAEQAVKKEMVKMGLSSSAFKIESAKKVAYGTLYIIDVYDEDGNYLGTFYVYFP